MSEDKKDSKSIKNDEPVKNEEPVKSAEDLSAEELETLRRSILSQLDASERGEDLDKSEEQILYHLANKGGF